MTDVVTDPADPRLADFVDLRHRQRGRGGDVVVVEGLLAVEQLVASGLAIRRVLCTPAKRDRLPPGIDPGAVVVAGLDVVRATVGFDLHRGIVASAARPAPRDAADVVAGARRVLVAERVNDLENLGSLFRNARAFACDAVLLDPETADPLARRPVRVSLGHVLRVPFARVDEWPAGLDLVRAAGLEVVALTPGGGPLRLPERVAFVVGAEGPGLSEAALAAADHRCRIPMAEGVDSLNVATAAAIALYAHLTANGADGRP